MKKISFAIIGGGPAGFYMSKCLAKLPQQPIIHIIEKQYCPFGLIRYGVAPDHISIKKSQTTLSSISKYPYFKYFGNQPVNLNELQLLKQNYTGVIYATGAQENNQPGWFKAWTKTNGSSHQIINARDIVYWYNNHPSYENYHMNLSEKKTVVIIGNGNVSIDISRILLKKVDDLIKTEISENALQSLKNNQVKNVILVGRRGFTHSAFSLKQVRQLSNLGIKIYFIEQELNGSMNQSSYVECTSIQSSSAPVVRMNKRKIDFIKEKCTMIKKGQYSKLLQNDQKKIIIRYLLDPAQIIDERTLKCIVTKLKGEPFKQVAIPTQQQQIINFDLLINSTGFKVSSIVDGQYSKQNNKIANSNGCVLSQSTSDKIDIGTYAVGWCKNGPKGVIDETLLSCEQTYNNIRIHINNNLLHQKQLPEMFTNSKVTFDKYLKLRQIELTNGDKQKFIKKKLKHKQIIEFFEK